MDKITTTTTTTNMFIIFIIFLTILDQTLSIKCYRCAVSISGRNANKTNQICTKFEETDYFVENCPFSTMCMKKVLKYTLNDGKEIETITRDCAQQKKIEQVYKEGGWHRENSIEEAYEEGCQRLEELTGAVTIYCHCRGPMCNSAPKTDTSSYHTDAMAVIFVFNVMKHLRSMDY